MTDDLDYQESLDRYFEIEAAELLQTIEQILLELVEEKTIERVHTLMRAAHTIKGSAANCGFKTIETIAHHLEDVFQALYPAELEIDPELGLLLMEGYECLYDPLTALLAGVPYDEASTLERTAELFARLQTHLGDFFGRETPLPTAAELGFDVIGSIFTDSIPQDLEDLATAIASQNASKVSESLNSLAEFLLELGGSYSLPGIEAIANTTLAALKRQPTRVLELAPIALANFQQAQLAIVGGDRSVGGIVSPELAAWSEGQAIESAPSADNSDDWLSLVDDSTPKSPTTTVATETTTQSDAAEDWLSLVDEAPAPAETTAQSDATEDWLSLVDEAPAPAETTAQSDAAEDWLSLVDETPVPAETDAAEDWLSLVDETPAPAESIDRSSILEHVKTVDDDTDVIEISTFFESEPTDFNADLQTEYIIETSDPATGSALTLSNNKSGIDRIFQSIWMGDPEPSQGAEFQQPETAPTAKSADPKPSADSSVSIRVATIQLERLSHTIGELTIDDNQQSLQSEQFHRLAQSTVDRYRRCEQKLRLVSDWVDKNALANDIKSSSRKSKISKHVKKRGKKAHPEAQAQFDILELDVYSDVSILVQNLTDEIVELGIAVNNLAEMAQKSRMSLSKRKQLLGEAQSELFEARMVEISGVLNRFPRLLQQMVASHRKPAQLNLIGSEVSIDKIIAEKLYDPLLHLVRNAYDHGIEPPEIRAGQGKSETGTVTIKVYHQGNRTKIEVSDDGQGLNWDKIKRRAIDLNLLSAANAATATEAELAEIMFAPGFSTADKVNDLSGRGIGLDVVRDRIGALQGKIDVRSIAGSGTTFVMQFPLNLTTTRLMICESQGFIHALRSEAISQVLLPSPDRITTQSLSSGDTSRFLSWGEGKDRKSIPIYSVNNLLDYRCPIVPERQDAVNLFPVKSKNSTNAFLLLDIDNEQICLEVNRILVEQELVVKSLGQTFGLANYIQGYSVLGDGSLTLALDPVELLARVRKTDRMPHSLPASMPSLQAANVQPALAPASDTTAMPNEIADKLDEITNRSIERPGKHVQVLVIDDSLVQRQSLTRSLTKAGCQVVQASHGREGILRLQEHPRIRLIVCDIEMPQMNGFEFLSYCRQDAKLSQIPIVMLTTRGGQKHRQLAMTLGAKDYLTKPQSDRELIDIVAKLATPSEVGV